MAIFSYLAKDFQGNTHKGEVETVDEYQAALLLKRKRLIVISVKTKNEATKNFFNKIFNRVSFADVVVVTRQLATMIQSGLVLSEALDILVDQQENKTFKKVLEGISSDIKSGIDFATTLEKYPDVFPPIFAKLVKAGQLSGKLDSILLELAENLEKDREFQSKVKGAMIYPVVVMTMMIGVMLIMIFFVMPKLLGLYTESGMELPLPTQIVIGFTKFMLNFWWSILLVIIIAVAAFRKFVSTPEGRLVVDRFLLKIPVLGRVIMLVGLTSFTRTFALLIGSGLSILEAIKVVSDLSGNTVFKNGFDLAYKGVERGLPFSTQILSLPVFPKIVGQMIKTGEETGKLDEIMLRLADYFESEVDNALKNLTTLIEPIVLVMLGVGVGFLVVSIILPIYQLTTNIK